MYPNNVFEMERGDMIGFLTFRHYVIDNDIEGAIVHCLDDGRDIVLNRYAVPVERMWPEYDETCLRLTGELLSKQSAKRKREREEKNGTNFEP